MEKGKKIEHTPVICGALYETKAVAPIFGKKVRAIMLSTAGEKDDDPTMGLIQMIGYPPERVLEGHERMDQFQLICQPAEPRPVGRPKTK